MINLPKNPFGGVDEQAAQEQFEDLCGGVSYAERLMQVWNNSYPTGMKGSRYYHTKMENFIFKANNEGFTEEQVNFFLAL